MQYKFNEIAYTLEKDDNNIFDYEEMSTRITSYFNDYDYILGDMSYNKIRLKGFCDKKNKIYRKINDINTLDNYLKEYCSYGCSWFLLKKVQ